MNLSPGQILSHYTILGEIGRGGMGVVYEALDTSLNRRVALKVLPAEAMSDPLRLERFRREARAVAALNHPGIVTIHSVEESEGIHFLTMELVSGKTLHQLIPDTGLALETDLPDCHPACRGPERSPRTRHRSPRPQAFQPDRDRRRTPEGARLRACEADDDRSRERGGDSIPYQYARHCRRESTRHDPLHVSRAGGRKGAELPVGYFLARRHSL